MPRKLFCQICPLTYKLSTWKCRAVRRVQGRLSGQHFARSRQEEPLPAVISRHSSLIRRRLGNANMELQENRAVNLALAAPCVSGILIREDGAVYRAGQVWREAIDPRTGNRVERTLLRENHARVRYDTAGLDIKETEPTA